MYKSNELACRAAAVRRELLEKRDPVANRYLIKKLARKIRRFGGKVENASEET